MFVVSKGDEKSKHVGWCQSSVVVSVAVVVVSAESVKRGRCQPGVTAKISYNISKVEEVEGVRRRCQGVCEKILSSGISGAGVRRVTV